jgi:glycosyltransferase involved in cell wall biosynthesis
LGDIYNPRVVSVDKKYLSVVVPAYNEAANLQAGALDKVALYLAEQSYDYEVLVVDDGSTDNTVELAEAFCIKHPRFRVICNPHRGKAFTVCTGLLAAQGKVVLFTDMDQATPIREAEKLLPWFEKGYDVVIGSRGTVRRNAPIWRRAMSRGQMLLRNRILGFKEITDTQCGFKSFRQTAIRPILDRLYFFNMKDAKEAKGATVTAGFDVEVLYVAKKLGFQVREVPVQWDYRFSRRVNLLRDSLKGIRELIDIRAANARGVYEGIGD